ncbi:MAG: chemotaxis protein CheW [Planctomycetota bacterium]|jgi:purine-binding chemotaxis protein CheW
MAESDIATKAESERVHRRVEELRRSFDDGTRRAPDQEVAQTESFLLLTLSKERYAYPVAHALEILQVPPIIPVPGAPPTVPGIINFRGRILSVTTIHGVLGLGPGDSGPAARVIVTKDLPLNTGILVDGVEGIAEIAAEDIQPAAAAVGSDKARHLAGEVFIDGRVVAVLDIKQLCASGSLCPPRPDPAL